MKKIEIFTKEDIELFEKNSPGYFLSKILDDKKLKKYSYQYDNIEDQIKFGDFLLSTDKGLVLVLEEKFKESVKNMQERIKENQKQIEDWKKEITRFNKLRQSIQNCQSFTEAFKILSNNV